MDNKNELIRRGLVPWCKSWLMRMGILDMLSQHQHIFDVVEAMKDPSDDVKSLALAIHDWQSESETIHVGESGTLYRFLRFIVWKYGLNKRFITSGTLRERAIIDDPDIIHLAPSELLKLDNETSQWASIAYLLEFFERGWGRKVKNPPFKLELTYRACDYWRQKKNADERWRPIFDETIFGQCETYISLLDGSRPNFVAKQSEDFCFARVFEYMTTLEGEARWPSLVSQESNRILTMDRLASRLKTLQSTRSDTRVKISSTDHRVVQAGVMFCEVHDLNRDVEYPKAVAKSWPQFWEFIEYANTVQSQPFPVMP